MGEAGFHARLTRTKTSGQGKKKTRELHVFIPRSASISGVPWLQVGYDLWRSVVSDGADFFVPRLSPDLVSFTNRVTTQTDFTAIFRKVLVELRAPSRLSGEWQCGLGGVVPDFLSMVWTGHSERATLPSWAACLGIPKEDRDRLGRWGASGSEEYVRTSRAVIKRSLLVIVQAARSREAFDVFDEAEALEILGKRLVDRGQDKDKVKDMVETAILTAKAVISEVEGEVKESGTRSAGWVEAREEPPLLPLEPKPDEVPDEEAAEQKQELEAKFVISVGRRRWSTGLVSTLHLRGGCWRGEEPLLLEL